MRETIYHVQISNHRGGTQREGTPGETDQPIEEMEASGGEDNRGTSNFLIRHMGFPTFRSHSCTTLPNPQHFHRSYWHTACGDRLWTLNMHLFNWVRWKEGKHPVCFLGFALNGFRFLYFLHSSLLLALCIGLSIMLWRRDRRLWCTGWLYDPDPNSAVKSDEVIK